MMQEATPRRSRPAWSRGAGIAMPIVWASLAALARIVLSPWVGAAVPYLTFYLAVLAAAWLGGLFSGVITLVFSVAFSLYFTSGTLADRISSVLYSFEALRFMVVGTAMTIVCEALRRSRDKARTQREELEILFDSIGDAVITTDAMGRVTRLNRVATELTGWSDKEANCRYIEDVFQIVHEETREPMDSPVRQVLRTSQPVLVANHTILIARDRTERVIDDSAAPIRDGENGIAGVVLIFRDISSRRTAERESRRIEGEIAESRERLALALTAADLGAWRADPKTRTVVRDAGFRRILGREDEDDAPTDFFASVHPDDAPAMREAFDQALTERTPYEVEVRVVRPDGSVRWVREKGRLVGPAGAETLAGVTMDITEEKNAERRVYELLLELREADRRKDEFLATLAHELRGPLAPLRSALEVLKLAQDRPGALETARATLDRQLGQMTRLVDDLIDVSRISRGRIELRKERTELASVIYQSVEVCRPLAEAAGQKLSVTLPSEPIFLDADPVRLTQVFTNLLGNSCKYTPAGGSIEIRADRDLDALTIRFSDNGMGIPPDMMTRIFDMFTQVATGQDRTQGGLGIGLSLVRSLVEIHGGTIEAQSEGEGQGSTFIVRLPVLPEGTIALPPTPVLPTRSMPRRRVLVVDDNRDGAAALGLLLTISGHEAHFAHDGFEALEAAERLRPDLVLLDLGMPRLNGFEAAKRIREQPWGRTMILVALTGWGQEEDRRNSKSAGFDHHMVKPLEYTALAKLLAEVPA